MSKNKLTCILKHLYLKQLIKLGITFSCPKNLLISNLISHFAPIFHNKLFVSLNNSQLTGKFAFG